MMKAYDEKPRYGLFMLWMVVYVCGLGLVTKYMDKLPAGIALPLLLSTIYLFLLGLFLMIYVTGRVYWYNGLTFKEARAATGERRKAYGLAHLRLFSLGFVSFLVLSALAIFLSLPPFLSIVFCIISIFICAFKSMKIRL